jgi:hypothetical protein
MQHLEVLRLASLALFNLSRTLEDAFEEVLLQPDLTLTLTLTLSCWVCGGIT